MKNQHISISKDRLLLIYDLWILRYKQGDNWYELTDYLRDKLKEDGININYDDKNKDILYNGVSLMNKYEN